MKWPRAIDLFAGSGGLTEGLRQAHFRVLAAIEMDRLSVDTYSRNHRGTVVWDRDIGTVSVAEVRRTLNLPKRRVGPSGRLSALPRVLVLKNPEWKGTQPEMHEMF